MEDIRVALFGVGGYAANYLYAIRHPERPGVRLVGAVEPLCETCDASPCTPPRTNCLRIAGPT
jgi:predicted dehydrogenase